MIRERYVIIHKLTHIRIEIYKLIASLGLISNLSTVINKNEDILKSFNSRYRFIIIVVKSKNIIFISIKTSDKHIEDARILIKNTFPHYVLLSSDFYIHNNIRFFNKFIKYENYLRRKIITILLLKYGENWWNRVIDKDISRICIKRARFDKDRFHYIFYADFLDIKKIISDNWKDLSKLFKHNKKYLQRLDIINKKRNNLFHGRFALK